MNVIRRRGWEIPERLATPEHLVFNRRNCPGWFAAWSARLAVAGPGLLGA